MKFKEILIENDDIDYDEHHKKYNPREYEYLKNHPEKMRGPHEGKEMNLIRAGLKDTAILPLDHRKKVLDIIKNFIISEKLFYEIVKFEVAPGMYTADIVVSKDKNKLNRVVELLKSEHPIKGSDEYHKELGKLLGYSEEQIEWFINNLIK